jgi:hypothetical protein
MDRTTGAKRLAAVLLLGTLSCSAPQPRDSGGSSPAESPSERRLAGVLRSDGFVVPFAEEVGGRWTLPGVKAPQDRPPDLADLPAAWFATGSTPPSSWRYVTLTGRTGALSTRAAVQARSHCQSVWGLVSDLPAVPLRDGDVHTAAGVATTGQLTLEPFVTLPGDSGEAERLLSWLKPVFDREEEAAAKEAGRRNPPVPPAKEREQRPIAIERIVRSRSPIGGRGLYYVEAVRYLATGRRPGRADGCGLQSFWTGWLSEVPATGELAVVTSHLDLTDCDRKGSASAIPLGLLRSGAEPVVITIDRFWEGEQYSMYATDGKTIRPLVRAYGGGC